MVKHLPNILSFIRIILAFIFISLYTEPKFYFKLIGVTIFIIAAITDFFDGYIARNYKADSKFGIFLDPLADKILTFAGFVCLPFLYSNIFPWWAIVIIVIRDIFTTVLRIYTDRKGVMMKTNKSAKIKTLIQMVFLYVALLSGVFINFNGFLGEIATFLFNSRILEITLYLIVSITVYTGIEYIIDNKQVFKRL